MPIYVPGKLTLAKDFTVQDYMWNFPQQYGLWSPAEITTALWLDAADASTIIESGGAVSQWNDKSGNGNHVAQSTSTLRPVVAGNVLDSKPVIRFDGSNDRLETAGVLFATPIFGIYSVTANRNPSGQSGWAGQYLAGDAGRTLIYQNDTNTRLAAMFGGSGGIVHNGTANSSFHLFGYEKNLSNGNLYYEGINVGTSSSLSTTISNTSWKIGEPAAGSGGLFFPTPLDAAEIVMLSAPASTSDRQKIEGYLAHKWGLTANLPAGHPYKTVSPTP